MSGKNATAGLPVNDSDKPAAGIPAGATPLVIDAPTDGADEAYNVGLFLLSLLAVVIGIVTGFGAVFFRDLIGLIHNVLFLGQVAIDYEARIFTPPSPWGVGIILVPVIGAVGVTFLVTNFAPEAKGHGVPEVMDAIYYRGGRIRPVVAIVKSLASALAIGSGAAVGREGPIIQIGSALASTIGQIVRMSPGQRIILVAAGAGAGIASTFNTPIGGVLFAIELMMPEVSVRTFLPVALATGTATFVGRIFFGQQPAFLVPPLQPMTVDATAALTLCLYGVLGVIVGLAAAIFIRGLHVFEDLFDRIGNSYARHCLGMLAIGVLIYVLQRYFGHYYVEGVGYSTIEAILEGHLTLTWLLALLFVCKLFATSTSLGSGSSGGVFSPSLFMGATIGGAFAGLLSLAPLPASISIPAFAMVGMGAMVGSATGAVMTAVAMIFEMTRDYDIVLPMILAVALSVGVRRMLLAENIYTLKLFRRGHVLPKGLHANMLLVRRAKEVMDTDVLLLPAEKDFDSFRREPEHQGRTRHVVVCDGERILGVLRVNTKLHQGAADGSVSVTLGGVASPDFLVIGPDELMFDVIERMWRRKALMAIVTRGASTRASDTIGIITKEHVADSMASSFTVYPSWVAHRLGLGWRAHLPFFGRASR